MDAQTLLYIPAAVGFVGLFYAAYLVSKINKLPTGTEKMKEISNAIRVGAMAFLKSEYKILIAFVIIVAAILATIVNVGTALAFLLGAIMSAAAGNIGMRTATAANAKTANACQESINNGLKVAFSSGAVMGLSVVGIGVLGIVIISLLYPIISPDNPSILFGFGFGASSIALFARVGGGIYTKGADVGADLVGKIEKNIPEDDPRNPAVIADNVGDNVGDVAGMGADLFESYVDSIIAAMILGFAGAMVAGAEMDKGIAFVFPLLVAAVGIISSIIGTFFVSSKGEDPQGAMNRGVFASAAIMAISSYVLTLIVLGDKFMGVYWATLIGLVVGVIIGLATEYYTSNSRKPTQTIAEAARTGAGTNVITGLAVGMMSTTIPVLAVSVGIILAYQFAGIYGIAIAAVGMLSTLGITLATDSYGPVADNAAGIAEMAQLGKEVRERAESLDAVGNTTAAMGKGFAIGSAALTALALFVAYSSEVMRVKGISSFTIDINQPAVVVGLFIGGLLPFLFSSFSMMSVGKAAFRIVNEVRRQFKEIPGLMEGTAKADYEKCVSISTNAAIKEMVVPGVLAILTPLLVGFILGAKALGGLLAGSIVTGFLLAVMMANAGGAWDNAKKYIEKGNFGGKGTDTHKAAVVGDTIGDPFKDTAGPSLNILIKLMTIVALIFAALFPI